MKKKKKENITATVAHCVMESNSGTDEKRVSKKKKKRNKSDTRAK
jgi:hypothetical protein